MRSTEQARAALEAIQALRIATVTGDAEAAALLLEVANRAVACLENLAMHPAGTPGRVAIDAAAARADSWPVGRPAIQELRASRPQLIPATLGSALPIRAKAGKTKRRNFESGTGIALAAFEDLDRERLATPPALRAALASCWESLTEAKREDWRTLAALLDPLEHSKESLAAWKKAGGLWAEWCCGGRWKTYAWPDEILNRAKQPTNSTKRGIATAVREAIGTGLAQLAPLPFIRVE